MNNKELNNLSIFELRDLARKVGVFNPTVLKKSDLISAICDIQTGKSKPHVAKTKQGRPPKEIGGYDRLVEIFLPSDVLEMPTKEERGFGHKSNDIQFNSTPSDDEEAISVDIMKGYLDELDSGGGLIRPRVTRDIKQQDMIFVSNKNMQYYNLKGGDEVICHAKFIRPDRARILYDVIEINGIPIDEYNADRSNFDDLDFNFDEDKINLNLPYLDNANNDISINYGDDVFCYPKKLDDFRIFMKKFIQENSSRFDNILYLSPLLVPKNEENLKLSQAEVFASNFCDSFENQRRTVFLAYNRAKRLAEMGKNVCFVIDDLYTLFSIDGDFYGDLVMSKTIISLGRRLNKGSITIFCNIPDAHHKYSEGVVLSVFRQIESVSLKLVDGKIDGNNSYRN